MNIHDIYRPFLKYFRSRRMRRFADRFQLDETTRILDIGGYSLNWLLIGTAPTVVLVNLDRAEWDDCRAPRFNKVQADGRHLPFRDGCFDIAFSNSVIEHVGDWEDQEAFAAELRRVAPRYFVQTPNRRFPIEPHLIAPLIHLLPKRLLRKLVRWCSVVGWTERPDQATVDAMLKGIRLLSRAELAALFPDAEIVIERVLGMPKSLIAERGRALSARDSPAPATPP